MTVGAKCIGSDYVPLNAYTSEVHIFLKYTNVIQNRTKMVKERHF